MEAIEKLLTDPTFRRVAVAIGYAVVVFVVRTLLNRMIFRSRLSAQSKLRWRAQVRNATVLAILLGVTLIWAEQLRTLALSVVAIAAAIAISTKEISACLLGSLVRASGRGFEIGDRVQIGEVRGDVIDIGPMTTALLEIGHGETIHGRTGRVVTLPNSVFLTQHIFNETLAHNYVLHVLRVPLDAEADWRSAEARLGRLGKEACADYYPEASESMTRAAMQRGVSPPRLEPNVYIEPVGPDRIDLLLRIPVPFRERDAIAQAVLRKFLAGEDVIGQAVMGEGRTVPATP